MSRCPCEKKQKNKQKYNIYDAIKEDSLYHFGIAESPHVDLEIQQKRLHICLACDRLFALTKNCKECGCFVKMKVKYKKSECPLGKWDAEE